MDTVGDLQEGIEEAEQLLGFQVVRNRRCPALTHRIQEPLRVSILAQGSYLIASIHTALDDEHFERFQHDLIDQIGQKRARGVIIDVAALDVLDSFGSRTLRDLGQVARLRGAETVVVGIQPEVAFAMVKFGINLEPDAHRAGPRGRPRTPRPARKLGRRIASAHGLSGRHMDGLRRLHQDYAAAFFGYLTRRDESGLRTAYELGRRAVSDPVGLLNLVHVHHEVLMEVLAHRADPGGDARHRSRRGGVPGGRPDQLPDDPTGIPRTGPDLCRHDWYQGRPRLTEACSRITAYSRCVLTTNRPAGGCPGCVRRLA